MSGGFIHMQAMSELGVFDHIVYLLDTPIDSKLLVIVLDGVENFMAYGDQLMAEGEDVNPYVKRFQELGGDKALEMLQEHPSEEVYTKTNEIIEKFFIAEKAKE